MCSDPSIGYYPQRTMCYKSAAHALAGRRLAAKHKGNEPGPNAPHPMDGMFLWVSREDLTPDDHFL